MRTIKFLIFMYFLFGFIINAVSQNDTIPPSIENKYNISSYIQSHVVYPGIAIENSIQGKVVVSFQITPFGTIDSIQVLESPDILLSIAVIKAIKETNYKWKPAKFDNKFVYTEVKFSTNFKLDRNHSIHSENFSLEKALKNSEKIRYLALYNKGYTDIPNDVYKLKKLFCLELDSNNLTEIPKEIIQLKELEFLVLSSNNIKSISSDLYKLKKLYKLDLSANTLTKVPLEIIKIKSLWELDLSKNQLNNIPAEIIEMKNIRRLIISNNNFDHFPIEILTNKKIDKLDLSNNNITEIPTEISRLEKLNDLNLSNNNISRLPDSIIKLKLLSLNLTGNNISRDEFKRIKALLPNTIIVYK